MRFFLAVFFLIVATSAHATFGPLRFLPLAPTTNDTLTVTVETFGCHAFQGGSNGFNREVQIVGNVIKITAVGTSNSDFVLCFFPRGDSTFNIGTVPANSYAVELYLRHILNPTLVELAQTGNVSVTQGVNNMVPVPSVSILSLLLLSFLIIASPIFIRNNP